MRLRWPDVQDAQQFLRRYLAPTRLLGACHHSNGATPKSIRSWNQRCRLGPLKFAESLCAACRDDKKAGHGSRRVKHGKSRGGGGICGNAAELPAKIFLPVNVNLTNKLAYEHVAQRSLSAQRHQLSLRRRTMPSRLVAFAELRHQFRRSRRNSDHLHRNNRPIVERFGDLGTNG